LFDPCIDTKTMLLLPFNANNTLIFYIHISNQLYKALWDIHFISHILP
jgi:hypothetical protein